MNDARERILDRVRAALRHPAPRPGFPARGVACFAPLPSDTESLIARFQRELESLRGEFARVREPRQAREWLRELWTRNSFQKVAAGDDPMLRRLLEGMEVQWVGAGGPAGVALEPVELAVTRADALVARTGSVLLSSRSAAGRALSVLAPVHLVVATAEELVPDLRDGLDLWRRRHGADWPSNAVVITGPSRTADIEKVLVLGAHGPKRLITLLVG